MCSFMRLEYVDCSISQNFGDCSWSIGDSNKSAQQGRIRGALYNVFDNVFDKGALLHIVQTSLLKLALMICFSYIKCKLSQ